MKRTRPPIPRPKEPTTAEAAAAGDVVVVTVPLKAYRDVPVEPLSGKIVIDTNNYYPERDGRIPELDDESTTASELLQAHLLVRLVLLTPVRSKPWVITRLQSLRSPLVVQAVMVAQVITALVAALTLLALA